SPLESIVSSTVESGWSLDHLRRTALLQEAIWEQFEGKYQVAVDVLVGKPASKKNTSLGAVEARNWCKFQDKKAYPSSRTEVSG
ncbi:hypothetical protein BGZ95_008976, partial [Linnemannia exigua]